MFRLTRSSSSEILVKTNIGAVYLHLSTILKYAGVMPVENCYLYPHPRSLGYPLLVGPKNGVKLECFH